MHFGAIICSLGARYKQYCSNIIRTLLVDPTQEQKDLYQFLLSLEEEIINKLQDGVKLSEVYQHAVDFVEKKDKNLVEKMTKNLGFVMGIEFREGSLAILPKSNSTAKKGMTFNIAVGFSGLENKEAQDSDGKIYALFLGDTVMVNAGASATVLTQSKKRLKSIAFIIKDDKDEESEEEKVKEKKKKSDKKKNDILDDLGRGRRTTVLENKLRVSCSFYSL